MQVYRYILIAISATSILFTLFVVDHDSVRWIKESAIKVGLSNTEIIIAGIGDIKKGEHIRGDVDADLVLVEYSDYSCLLCAAMRDIFNRMLKEEKVQIIYRHLYKEYSGGSYERAVASECVARLLGEKAFQKYNDFLYEKQYTLRDEDIYTEAIRFGANSIEFNECIENNNDVREKIQSDSEEGWRLGARGTPYIIVVYKGEPVGISYANDYESFISHIFSFKK